MYGCALSPVRAFGGGTATGLLHASSLRRVFQAPRCCTGFDWRWRRSKYAGRCTHSPNPAHTSTSSPGGEETFSEGYYIIYIDVTRDLRRLPQCMCARVKRGQMDEWVLSSPVAMHAHVDAYLRPLLICASSIISLSRLDERQSRTQGTKRTARCSRFSFPVKTIRRRWHRESDLYSCRDITASAQNSLRLNVCVCPYIRACVSMTLSYEI